MDCRWPFSIGIGIFQWIVIGVYITIPTLGIRSVDALSSWIHGRESSLWCAEVPCSEIVEFGLDVFLFTRKLLPQSTGVLIGIPRVEPSIAPIIKGAQHAAERQVVVAFEDGR